MKSIIRIVAATAAVFTLAAAHGEDYGDFFSDSDSAGESVEDDSAGGAVEDESDSAGEGEGESAEGAPAKKVPERVFHLIPFCRELEGRAEVFVPSEGEWKDIVEGRYYPLGSTFRTSSRDSRLRIKFGPEAEVVIRGAASFSTRAQKLDEKTRAINLVSGTITVKLPTDLPEGWFTVNAPGFSVTSAIGESRYTYRKTGDGDEAVIRCVTQTLSVEGRHFKAPAMKAANEIRIRTSEDQLTTVLFGSRGDVLMQLDQGLFQDKDYSTGEKKIKARTLDWKLSPKTTVRIHRAKPAVGKNLAVTIMTFDSKGELRNRCAFAENMFEVNSGEIGPTTRKEREELAKKAAQIAEQQASEMEATDADAESTEGSAADGSSSGDATGSSDSGSDEFEF